MIHLHRPRPAPGYFRIISGVIHLLPSPISSLLSAWSSDPSIPHPALPPRPFFFDNIFQSAPVVAAYVAAALEADVSWQRIERFFISSIEGDKLVKV